MGEKKQKGLSRMILLTGIAVTVILVFGTLWMGQKSKKDSVDAAHSVSLLYLDELAGRRKQVVEDTLKNNIDRIETAVSLLTEEDLKDIGSLQSYQSRMKQLFSLERFAFVDENGHVYTAMGVQEDIDDYSFDYKNISGPEISVKNPDGDEKKVVIAIPVDLELEGNKLVTCFMEINMDVMLKAISIQAQESESTYCNLYMKDGTALTNMVLGGQAAETNLLDALATTEFDKGYSLENVVSDFQNGKKGVVSFTYNGISETLSYVPVEGTDWLLSYLIRESVVKERISTVSDRLIRTSLLLSALMAAVLLTLFGVIDRQTRKASQAALERETAEAENRARREELEQRISLQEKLLQQERQQARMDNLIKALASDYKGVYYVELDKNDGICYLPHMDVAEGVKAGEHYDYMAVTTAYAEAYVLPEYQEEFLEFTRPDVLKKGLESERVISYLYMVHRDGKDSYEMIRFAGVKNPEDKEGEKISSVGLCFTDVDAETRRTLAQNEALSAALISSEEANKAKTAFLSNMSHEIRTPMNAIIGLNNIAMNDEETPEKIKGYLVKIGESAEHLLNLINDILDMSRIESGRMTLRNEEFSFSGLLEAVNTMISGQCHEKGIDYQCYINGQVDDYYIGDNMKLRQVLINILGNAVKFTPAGGKVDFTVEKTAGYDGKSTLCFVMKDTGIGMSEEFLPHLFDTFSQENSSATNRYGSSGLGMAITKNIVEMMNGNIEVESTQGKGTTFTVYVTLLDSDRIDHDTEVNPQDMCVLIVDDDPVACEHARLVLEKAGIASETAESGAQAIEMVSLRHARRQPYNLILVDWKMPEMDGVETTRRIRSIVGNESAIIILTAYRWDDILEEAMQAGVDSFISKPIFANAVLEEFSGALKKKNIRAGQERKKADLTGKRVLLAEDMQVNAEIMLMVLETRAMEADVASNGRIAVEMFAEKPEGYYDVILMDMRMPEMDGLEATRVIRAMDRADAKTIPIIALTANAFDEDVQRSMQAGLNAHLSKPVDPDNLFETLEGMIS